MDARPDRTCSAGCCERLDPGVDFFEVFNMSTWGTSGPDYRRSRVLPPEQRPRARYVDTGATLDDTVDKGGE